MVPVTAGAVVVVVRVQAPWGLWDRRSVVTLRLPHPPRLAWILWSARRGPRPPSAVAWGVADDLQQHDAPLGEPLGLVLDDKDDLGCVVEQDCVDVLVF